MWDTKQPKGKHKEQCADGVIHNGGNDMEGTKNLRRMQFPQEPFERDSTGIGKRNF